MQALKLIWGIFSLIFTAAHGHWWLPLAFVTTWIGKVAAVCASIIAKAESLGVLAFSSPDIFFLLRQWRERSAIKFFAFRPVRVPVGERVHAEIIFTTFRHPSSVALFGVFVGCEINTCWIENIRCITPVRVAAFTTFRERIIDAVRKLGSSITHHPLRRVIFSATGLVDCEISNHVRGILTALSFLVKLKLELFGRACRVFPVWENKAHSTFEWPSEIM